MRTVRSVFSEEKKLSIAAALVHGGGLVASAEQPGYSDQMPLRHNAARRHRIPKQRWRVTHWPAYEAGLRRRDDLTFWLDEALLPAGRLRAGARRADSPNAPTLRSSWC